MSNSPTETDPAHADIGLVSALPIELRPFVKKCDRVRDYTGGTFTFRGGLYDGLKVAMVETGMGYARARRATELLLEAHTPRFVIATGFCGALVPEVQVGHIVMANALADQHGHELTIDVKATGDPRSGLHVGRMLTADNMVRLVEEKRLLAEQHDAIAVDMEALAVAQVCTENRIRHLSVKAASDDLSADLPAEVMSIMGDTGSVRIGAAIGAVFRRPSSVKEMWQLRENAWKASDRLASFLDGVVLQIGASLK